MLRTHTGHTVWGVEYTFQWNDKHFSEDLADQIFHDVGLGEFAEGKTVALTVF